MVLLACGGEIGRSGTTKEKTRLVNASVVKRAKSFSAKQVQQVTISFPASNGARSLTLRSPIEIEKLRRAFMKSTRTPAHDVEPESADLVGADVVFSIKGKKERVRFRVVEEDAELLWGKDLAVLLQRYRKLAKPGRT